MSQRVKGLCDSYLRVVPLFYLKSEGVSICICSFTGSAHRLRHGNSRILCFMSFTDFGFVLIYRGREVQSRPHFSNSQHFGLKELFDIALLLRYGKGTKKKVSDPNETNLCITILHRSNGLHSNRCRRCYRCSHP